MSQITQLFECSHCKQPLVFRHAESNIKVCNCGTVNKKENDAVNGIVLPVLQSQDSIIQIGSKGKYQDKEFEVIGRFRAWFNEYVYNYWSIVLADGSFTYLSEGYGIYSIYEKQSERGIFHSLRTWTPGNKVRYAEDEFQVQFVYDLKQMEVEGETMIPAFFTPFEVSQIVSANNKHIEVFAPNYEPVYYRIYYTDLSTLAISNTRNTQGQTHTFTCTNCKSDIILNHFPYTQSCACSKCNALFSYKNGHFSKQRTTSGDEYKPLLPIGTKGTLNGHLFEVVGAMLKQDYSTYQSQWREYTLWNEKEGFIFLSEYEGHWTLVKEFPDFPAQMDKDIHHIRYGSYEYDLYNRYSFAILGAKGEFPGDILNDSQKDIHEYIYPPEMLIREKNESDGIVWFKGSYISSVEIENSFGISCPAVKGRGVLETRGFIPFSLLAKVTIAILIVFTLVHTLLSFTHDNEEIFYSEITFPDSANTVGRVSNVFKLDKKTNLQFQIYSPLNNSWLEIGATLVNIDNGSEYSLEQGVEFYSGFEDGESWSEGARDATAYLSSIPAGRYKLQVEASKDKYALLTSSTILVKKDVGMERNLFILLALLLIWPVTKFILIRNAEKDRWYDSPYSPYDYEE